MSYLIKMRGSTKKHLLLEATSTHTVCGRKVKSGEIMDEIQHSEFLNLCEDCYAWVGRRMIVDWLGYDFFVDDYDTSISTKKEEEK